MSSVAPSPPSVGRTLEDKRALRTRTLAVLRANWLLVIGVLALAVPTIIAVATQIWSTDDGAHGPIILASGCWLLARQWPRMVEARRPPPLHHAILWMVPALLIYLFGRVVGVLGIEVFGLMASLVGALFAFSGFAGLRAIWFPILYLAFLIPLPDTLVALVTQPMKLGISQAATAFLQLLGYPVANTGVTLQVAQYELMVADACSGLNAIISLSAIGLFYVYVLHRSSWRYALLLLAFVLPCAIFANFMRVLLLILITYHFGNEAAQGFLHDVAGMFTFVLALLTIFTLDHLLARFRRPLAQS